MGTRGLCEGAGGLVCGEVREMAGVGQGGVGSGFVCVGGGGLVNK